MAAEQAVKMIVKIAVQQVLEAKEYVQRALGDQDHSGPYQGFCRHLMAKDAQFSRQLFARDIPEDIARDLLSSTDTLVRYWFDDDELDYFKDCFDENGKTTGRYFVWVQRPLEHTRLARLLRFEKSDSAKSDWVVRQQAIVAQFVANMSSILDYTAKRLCQATPVVRYIPDHRLGSVLRSVYFPLRHLPNVPIIEMINSYSTIATRHKSTHSDAVRLVPARPDQNELGLDLQSVADFTGERAGSDFSVQFMAHLTHIMTVRQSCHSYLVRQGQVLRAQAAEAGVQDTSLFSNLQIAMAAFEAAPPPRNMAFSAHDWEQSILVLECSGEEGSDRLRHVIETCRSILHKKDLLAVQAGIATAEQSELEGQLQQQLANLLTQALSP